MVRTHGLTHIALAVRDAERSLKLYQDVFGVVPVYRQEGFIQAQTPGSRDVVVFEEKPKRPGRAAASLISASACLNRATSSWRPRRSGERAARSRTKASFAPASRTCSSPIPTATRSNLVRDTHAGRSARLIVVGCWQEVLDAATPLDCGAVFDVE